jgi:hypothetical protein
MRIIMIHVCLILLLSLTAAAQVKTANGVTVILGRVQSADLKYPGMEKQIGRSYRGAVHVKVVRILDQISIAKSAVVRQGNSISVHIEERTRKPTWELRTGRLFVMGVQPLPSSSLRPLFVIAVEANPDLPQPGFAECVAKAGLSSDEFGAPIWLSSAQLHERAVRSHPMEMPGLMDGHAKGQVDLVVELGETGRIECAQFVDGYPLFSASALDAATKYRFRPYVVKGHESSVLGTLILDFDFHRGRR